MTAETGNRRSEKPDQAEAVRLEIQRHAQDLFHHYGFWKTNIGDIAERCGMSPGNLYRYYRNKQAIGLAVIETYFAMVETSMETELMLPGGTAEDRIKRFLEAGIRHMVDELERSPKIVELAEFLCEDEQGIEVLQAHIDWKRRRLAREIEAGIARGELAPCAAEKTAGILLNAIKVFFIPMSLVRWRDRTTILPELREILDMMFRGLLAR